MSDSASIYRIELPLELQDNTSQGARSATSNLQGIMAAANQASAAMGGVTGKQHQVTVSLVDRVSSAVSTIGHNLTQLTGKTWALTLQVRDFVTAPLKGMLNLIQTIAQTITNPWNMLGAIGIGYAAQEAISHGVLAPLEMYDTQIQRQIGVSATMQGRGMSAAEADKQAAQLLFQAQQFGKSSTPFTSEQVQNWTTAMYTQGFSKDKILGTGPNNEGSYLKAITDSVIARRGLSGSADNVGSVVQQFANAQSTGFVTGDLTSGLLPYMPVWDILGKAFQKNLGFTPPIPMMQSWAAEKRIPLGWMLDTLTSGAESTYPGVGEKMTKETFAGQKSILTDIWQQDFMKPFGGGESGPIVGTLDKLTQNLLGKEAAGFMGQDANGKMQGLSASLEKIGNALATWGTEAATNTIGALQKLFENPEFNKAMDSANIGDMLKIAWTNLTPDLSSWLSDIGKQAGDKAGEVWGWIGDTLQTWIKNNQAGINAAASGIGTAIGSAINAGVMGILGLGGGTTVNTDPWTTAGVSAGTSFWTAFADALTAQDLGQKVKDAIIGGPKNVITGENGGISNPLNTVPDLLGANALLSVLFGAGIGKVAFGGAKGVVSLLGNLFKGGAGTVAETASAVAPEAAAAGEGALPFLGEAAGAIGSKIGPLGVMVALGFQMANLFGDAKSLLTTRNTDAGRQTLAQKAADDAAGIHNPGPLVRLMEFLNVTTNPSTSLVPPGTPAVTGLDANGDKVGLAGQQPLGASPLDAIPILGGMWSGLTTALDRLRAAINDNTATRTNTAPSLSAGVPGASTPGSWGGQNSGPISLEETAAALQAAGVDPVTIAYICGPIGVQGILKAYGINKSLPEVAAEAAKGGYGPAGMGGTGNFVRTLAAFGVTSHETTKQDELNAALRNGGVASISTPYHYFDVQGINDKGQYDTGNSGIAVGGQRWMSLSDIEKYGRGSASFVIPDALPAAPGAINAAGGAGTGPYGPLPGAPGGIPSQGVSRYNEIAPILAAAGIDPLMGLAITKNEVGWDEPGSKNLFSIGTGKLDANGNQLWEQYPTDSASAKDFIALMQTPHYAKAWADRGNPTQMVQDLRDAGYAGEQGPKNPNGGQVWVSQVDSIYAGWRTGDTGGARGGPASAAASGVVIQTVNLNIGAGADEESGKAAGAAFLATITSAVHSAVSNRTPAVAGAAGAH